MPISSLPNIFLFSLLISIITHSCSQCLNNQKILLLELKNELIFEPGYSTKLVQWNQTSDCCSWFGVECDDAGNVKGLQLEFEGILDGIGNSSSLFKLKYLEKLNLGYNLFNNSAIPRGIRSLTYLTHLNLSQAGFSGQVPLELSFLTRLVSLDISNPPIKLALTNLDMLVRNLTRLRVLHLDGVDISSQKSEWSYIIPSYLPHLTSLSLSYCNMSGPLDKSLFLIPTLRNLDLSYNEFTGLILPTVANLTQLITLDLSGNFFSGPLPSTLFAGFFNLESLYLGYNLFTGNIPMSLFGLPSLQTIFLYSNQFTGQVEEFLVVNVSNIRDINLSNNRLEGPIPYSFFKLEKLTYLYLSSNLLSGTFRLEKIQSLPFLKRLDLSNNFLSVKCSSLVGFPQLVYLGLASCNLSEFPGTTRNSPYTDGKFRR